MTAARKRKPTTDPLAARIAAARAEAERLERELRGAEGELATARAEEDAARAALEEARRRAGEVSQTTTPAVRDALQALQRTTERVSAVELRVRGLRELLRTVASVVGAPVALAETRRRLAAAEARRGELEAEREAVTGRMAEIEAKLQAVEGTLEAGTAEPDELERAAARRTALKAARTAAQRRLVRIAQELTENRAALREARDAAAHWEGVLLRLRLEVMLEDARPGLAAMALLDGDGRRLELTFSDTDREAGAALLERLRAEL